jgi:hypothetical protein
MNVKEFILANGISMEAEAIRERPDRLFDDAAKWQNTASHWHWRCILRYDRRHAGRVDGRKRLTVYFSQGSAHTKPPEAWEVLHCLAMDASSVSPEYGNASYEQWAREFGFDEDSRSGERVFKACAAMASKLCKFLGPEAFANALTLTEE